VERILQIRQLLLRSKRVPWVVLGLTLGILAGAILVTTQQTRLRIRQQIAGRDGEILYAVARMQMPDCAEDADLVGRIEDPGNQLTVILETSRMSGVMGARLFDTNGQFVESFPADVVEHPIDPDDLPALQALRPVSHFLASLSLAEVFLPDSARPSDGRLILVVAIAGSFQQAIASTRRMQAMINEVVAVLREEEGAGQYEIPVAELIGFITAKVQTLCRERGVELITTLPPPVVLPNRAANLVALILANLVQNAIEATPPGKVVNLSLALERENLVCEVRDQGAGLPAGRNVFVPCRSLKEGGSGIGLAISKQLANHLGAALELLHNSPAGCTFGLSLPASLWKTKTRSVTLTLG